MLPLRTLLCPTDFSEPSLCALVVAVELAQHFGAELALLHVITPLPTLPAPMVSSLNVASYQSQLRKAGEQELAALAAKQLPPGLAARLLVATGDAADEIVRAAADAEAGLVVIATHGRTGWRRFVSGSVTEKVVRLASCPVLTIRCPPADEG
jgi:nucleotide-binding universal stress UspA family protein